MFTFTQQKAAYLAGTTYDPLVGERCFVFVPDEMMAAPDLRPTFPVTFFNGSVAYAKWSDAQIPEVAHPIDGSGETVMVPVATKAVELIDF
jgi:hypothetical protein